MGRQDRFAALVSNVAAPPVLAVIGAMLMAQRTAAQGAWRWALAFTVAAVLFPSAYVGVEVWRGGISDIHVQDRSQRIRPFAVALICGLAVWLAFVLWPAPPEFRMLALANSLQVLIFIVITLRWKISLHSAAAGSLSVLGAIALSAGSGMLLALTVPVVAWARIRLDRHTLAQTVSGAIVGVLAVALAMWVM